MKVVTVLLIIVLLFGRDSVSQAQSPDDAPAGAEDYRTEQQLRSTERPARNLYELYPRLRGLDPAKLQRVVGSTAGWGLGTTQSFSVGNLATKEYTQKEATLRLVSENAYWFVENGLEYEEDALQRSADRFEGIVEKNRATFGSEWRPGVDNDPRMVVLMASIPGAGGYYSSADEYPKAINPFSNQHEMMYVNIDPVQGGSRPGDSYFESILAHEFQHMIHWNEHSSQDVWLNEGMSEYAIALNGLRDGLPEADFAARPDLQLNTWTDSPSSAGPHYGQAYRFMTYLAERFGSEFMAQIIRQKGGGLDAVDSALRSRHPRTDLRTVYAEWLVANDLVNEGAGALGYKSEMTSVTSESAGNDFTQEATVEQWGADYYNRNGNDAHRLIFEAGTRVRLIGNDPKDGEFEWYSNRGDLLNSHLTREVDLSPVKQATLEVDLWYDIELDYDYGYVEVSTDNGKSWTTLKGARTTDSNPNGNNLGNGLTGKSDGWVTERFDLGPYTGKRVQLRIEYVTDDGYNAQGMAVDGVRIPEIGLSDDSESDNGWKSNGWVRTNNWLPARYRLLALDPDGGGSFTEIPVGADGRAVATFRAGTGKPPVIVVGGAAETTTQPSSYRLQVQPAAPGMLGIIGGRARPPAATSDEG